MLKLTKKIPSRTKTVNALWCQPEYRRIDQRYRDVRFNNINRMDRCYWCGYAFVDGEMMGLAAFEYIGNRVLCQPCEKDLLASKSADGE